MNGDPQEAEGLTLRDYLAVVWRRMWIIVLVTVVATAAAYFFAARQPDMYMATTDLIFESQIDVANPLSQYGYTDPYERDLEMRAITNIMASPDMIARAEAILDEEYDGEYASNAVDEGAAGAEGDGSSASAAATPDDSSSDVPGYSVSSAVPETGSNNAVGSNVVSITGTSTDPALAAAAANAYADAFVV